MRGCLLKIRIVVKSEGDGFYASCPDLKGVYVYGDTEDEAFSNAKDAASTYLAMTIRHGDPIPLGIVHWRGSLLSLMLGAIRRLLGQRRRESTDDLCMSGFVSA